MISSVLDKGVSLVNSATQCAIETERVLNREGLLNKKKSIPRFKFFVSDEPERFAILGRRFLGSNISCIKRTDNV